MNKLIKEIIIIFLLSAVSSLLYNAVLNKNVSLVYQKKEFKQGQILSTKDAQRLFRNGDVLFIDARTKEDYEDGHIKNAQNLPVHSSRMEKMNFMSTIPRDKKIVVYCIDADCPSAERLSSELNFMGYKNIMIYSDGWDGWEKAGYPIERNISHE